MIPGAFVNAKSSERAEIDWVKSSEGDDNEWVKPSKRDESNWAKPSEGDESDWAKPSEGDESDWVKSSERDESDSKSDGQHSNGCSVNKYQSFSPAAITEAASIESVGEFEQLCLEPAAEVYVQSIHEVDDESDYEKNGDEVQDNESIAEIDSESNVDVNSESSGEVYDGTISEMDAHSTTDMDIEENADLDAHLNTELDAQSNADLNAIVYGNDQFNIEDLDIIHSEMFDNMPSLESSSNESRPSTQNNYGLKRQSSKETLENKDEAPPAKQPAIDTNGRTSQVEALYQTKVKGLEKEIKQLKQTFEQNKTLMIENLKAEVQKNEVLQKENKLLIEKNEQYENEICEIKRDAAIWISYPICAGCGSRTDELYYCSQKCQMGENGISFD